MALQSPTTLLNSIQYMKNKLRSDKQTLMDIKNDFTMFAKKPKPCPPSTAHQDEFVLQDITPHVNVVSNSPTKQAQQRGKVMQLKKEHQRELVRLREEHEKQIAELLRVKNLEIEDVQNRWRCKLEEQAGYISILQDQISSPIQTQRERVPSEQYDAIINKLLQENTRLHETTTQLTEQCERLRKLCSQLDSQRTSRSRFRFAKGRREEGKASQYASEQSQVHRRVSSVYLYNDENVDHSNSNQWDDIEIQDDQGCLKTIRQFEKSVLEENNYKMKGDGYLSLKI